MTGPLSDFLDAIAKLPEFSGVTFRGLAAEEAQPPPLGVVAGVLASSLSPRVASENFTSSRLLVLLNRTGRSLAEFSAHPEEGEVLVRPGSVWRALIEVGVPGLELPALVLEELDLSGRAPAPAGWGDTLDELAARVTRLIQEGLASEYVPVVVAGKYTGSWPAQEPPRSEG